MVSAFDIAWAVLKNVDFSDIGPMPTRYQYHPDSVQYRTSGIKGKMPSERPHFEPNSGEHRPDAQTRQQIYERDPEMAQTEMEESYIPDVQQMLELEGLRQASGGQQAPVNMLRDPHYYGAEWWNQPYQQMYNIPEGGTENLPLPVPTE